MLVQYQDFDQEKKVFFKVFVFWRYSKTLRNKQNKGDLLHN